MKKYEQKGNTTLILLAALVALLAVAGYMVTSNTLVTPKPSPTPGIMSSSDLEKAGKDLDSVNIDSLDNDLNAVTKDAAAI